MFIQQGQVGGGLIERPRLLDKLRRASEHKLTLICAPPGYGKTTLVGQYIRQSPLPVVWHTLEERERDIPILYARCLTLLSSVLPDIHTLQPSFGYPPGELAILIADYMRDALSGDIFYVLDDAHLLAASQAAENWLQTFVTHLPPTCHMILLSRIPPDLPLTEMISRREVQAIGPEELRLTPFEIEQLAREMLGSNLPTHEVHTLATRLGGWPAGTVLALHPFPPEFEQAIFGGKAGPEALFESLASAMLNGLPSGLRDFLLASSTLSRMTPELCSVALELPDSDEWLAQTQSRNLFLSRVMGGLVYHTLFRSFLQRELYQANQERFAALHAKAARWFEAHHHLDEAFEHYVAAGLAERAASIAEQVAQSYYSQGKVETLLGWRESLKQTGAVTPQLLSTCAKIHMERYEYEIAQAELTEAEAGFVAQNDRRGIADIRLHRAFLMLQHGDFDAAVAQATVILEQWPEHGTPRGQALSIIGTAQLHMGEVAAAVHSLEEALPLFRAEGDAHSLSILLQNLDTAYIRMGRFDDAAACLQEVVALRRSLGSAGLLALALNNLGYHYHQHGDYQQALKTYQEGLSVIARVPNRRAESYLLWSFGDLQRDRGALSEAMQMYQKALELIGNSEPVLRCSLLVSAATLRRWQGNLFDSISLAGEAAALAQAHGMVRESTTAQAALWAARAQMGKAAEALESLESLTASLRPQESAAELEHMLGLCAHAALLCSNRVLAEHYLEAACRQAHSLGSAQLLATEVLHSPALETLVNAAPSHFDLLHDHLTLLREAQYKRVDVHVRVHHKSVSNDTYSLRVYTLGRETIERDGKRIPPSVWRATAARELFFYLLFMGGSRREQICLTFWPDSSARQVRNNFHTTLFRARQALGENVIAFQDGVYILSPELEIWCDALELETLARQTRLLSPRDARTEDLWRRAVLLHQGDFLPSLDADWALARRESLREDYLDAMVGVAECARARNDFKEALIRYKSALAADPYREDVHRAIITCYARLGEKSRGLAHFRQFKALLLQDLAVEPSEETMILAKKLLA
jgi:LuxR family maltose regulon positive regulatory protein